MPATTGQLGLVTPTQGDLSGTWGNTVNNGITEYTNIAIAGTTTFNGDGAVTLENTTGNASATNIASTSAQYMIVRVTGTLTTTKIITFGSAGSAPYSKLYLVDNSATGGAVTFKAYGQTGVTVAVGEKTLVFYNGTDIVKVSSSTAGTGSVTSVAASVPSVFSIAGSPITTSGTLAMTYSGIALPVANGGTGLTAGTSGGVLAYTASGTLASSAALTANALVIGGGAGVAPSTTTTGTGVLTFLGTPSSANLAAAVTDETGSGALVFATSPTLVTPVLGTPSSGTLSSCTVDGTNSVGFLNIPQNAQSGSYTMVLADAGKHIYHASGDGAATYTIPAASSVAYPLGTAITFVNLSATSVSIAITTDTMYLSSAGTTGTRTLAQYGSATAIKVSGVSSSGIWVISGSGLT
jgi:hypothetical protein